MKASYHFLLSLFVSVTLLGCQQTQISDARPKVVATTTIIADLVQQVGGERVNLHSILTPGNDPHVYEPVPQDSVTLETARIIFYNGYNLEPGLIRMIQSTGTEARTIAVAEQVTPLDTEKEGAIVPDPHVWGDARNGIIMVEVIEAELTNLLPQYQEEFQENADQIIQDLEQLDQWIRDQIATIPPEQRYLVTTHDAFAYYSQAYDIPVAGTLIGISTEEQPSAQTLKDLVEEIKKIGVKAIFAETTINPTLITTVAEEAGVTLAPQQLYADSIGAPGSEGDTYIKMLKANTEAIVEGLTKRGG